MTRVHRVTVAALATATLGSCAREPLEEALRAQFEEAERLILDAQYDGARDLLKDYLLYRPDDAGAHYYLGRSYAEGQDFRPIMAEGEFQTALRLFIAQGRHSPIERFGTGYFEMICDLDSAKALYNACDSGMRMGASDRALLPLIERAAGYVESARTVMPDAAEVEQVGSRVRRAAEILGAGAN